MNDLSFLSKPSLEVAPQLLGWILERQVDNRVLRARIVEVEAYDQNDEASHSYKPMTARTEVMFGPSGRLYVYFTYGMYYCANIVTDKNGYGSGVLIRAVEPLEGEDIMARNRGGKKGKLLTNGPGKLTQALGIDFELRGHNLDKSPLKLIKGELSSREDIVTTTRIGISKAQQEPRRFYIRDNEYVSRY